MWSEADDICGSAAGSVHRELQESRDLREVMMSRLPPGARWEIRLLNRIPVLT